MSRPVRLLLALALVAGACAPIDTSKARPYACAPDGGDACPGGWRCGLDGVCFDPATAHSGRCASELDCGLWHCGPKGVCVDVLDAGASACRPNAGDCAPGWRCGLEGVCHPDALVLDYLCASDTDCAGGWRCSPLGRCVDASRDALRPATAPGQLELGQVSPALKLPANAPLLSISPVDWFQSTWKSNCFLEGSSVAVVTDAGVTAVVDMSGSYDITCHPLGVTRTVPPPSASVSGVAAVGMRVYVNDDQGLWEWAVQEDGGGDFARVPFEPMPGAALTLASASPYGRVAAYSAQGFQLYTAGDDAGTGLLHVGGQAQPVYDVSPAAVHSLLISARDGLFYAPADEVAFGHPFVLADGGLSPVPEPFPLNLPELPNAACGGAPTWRVTRVRTLKLSYVETVARSVLRLEPVSGDDGVDRVMVLGQPQADDGVACGPHGFGVMGPFVPCGPGERLVDEHLRNLNFNWLPDGGNTLDGAYAELLVRCRGTTGDAGVADTTRLYEIPETDAGVLPLDPTLAVFDGLTATAERSNPWSGGYVDQLGRLWICDQSGCASVVSLTTPRGVLGTLSTELAGLTATGLTHYDPSIGFHGDSTSNVCGPIVGAPYLSMQCPDDRSTGFGRATGFFVTPWLSQNPQVYLPTSEAVTGDPDPRRPGAVGAVAIAPQELPSASDGGADAGVDGGDAGPAFTDPLIVATAGDTLWSSDGHGGYLPRLVPLPGQRFTALAFVDSADGGWSGKDLVTGLALVSQHLFVVQAADESTWRAREVPAPSGSIGGLWSDGFGARVGYVSGQVVSLPSQLVVAPALPSPVTDYAALCGTGYALAGGALFQLGATPDGGASGEWRTVPLDALVPEALVPKAFGPGARLFSDGDELLLFSTFGTAYWIRDPACSPR